MQSEPFKTFAEANQVKEKEYLGKHDYVYARQNPNKEKGGFVVVYGDILFKN